MNLDSFQSQLLGIFTRNVKDHESQLTYCQNNSKSKKSTTADIKNSRGKEKRISSEKHYSVGISELSSGANGMQAERHSVIPREF